MKRSCDYRSHTIEVTVEVDPGRAAQDQSPETSFVAVVRIFRTGLARSVFSPLRFGEPGGRSFVSANDAFEGGFAAAQRIVDDLVLPDTGP